MTATNTKQQLRQIVEYWRECLKAENALEKGISIYSRSKAVLCPFSKDELMFGSGTVSVTRSEKVKGLSTYVASKGQSAYYGYPLLFYRHATTDKYEVAPLFIVEVTFNKQPRKTSASRGSGAIAVGVNAMMKLGLRGEQISQLNEQLEQTVLSASLAGKPLMDECLKLVMAEAPFEPQEMLTPRALSADEPLSKSSRPGIYNKAVFFAGDEQGFNFNLLRDLDELRTRPDLIETSLGALLQSEAGDSSEEAGGEENDELSAPILPFQLNEYQQAALQNVLTRKVSVVTGPPGTGKSQFITSLLINLFFQGRSALLVSHTNQAVDVVNGKLEEFPGLLLRTGRKALRQDLKRQFSELQVSAAPSKAKPPVTRQKLESRWVEIEQLRADICEQAAFARQLEAQLRAHALEAEGFGGTQAVRPSYRWDDDSWQTFIAVVTHLTETQAREQSGEWSFWTRVATWLLPGHLKRQKRNLLTKATAHCPKDVPQLTQEPVAGITPTGFDDPRWAWWRQYLRLVGLWRKVQTTQRRLSEFDARPPLGQSLRHAETEYYALCQEFVTSNYAKLSVGGRSGAASHYLDEISGGRFGREFDPTDFERAVKALPLWSCTLKSLRSSFPLAPNIFDVVIFDEASQVDLPSAAPALYRAKQAIVVGDPMQLTHIATLTRQAEGVIAGHIGVDREKSFYPSRARYTDVSLYKSAERSPWGPPTILLNHYRSKDAIAKLFNEVFYHGRLNVLTDVASSNLPPELEPCLRWYDCKGTSTRPKGGSRINDMEVAAVVQAVQRLLGLLENTTLTIGIVTPFSAQQNAIHKLLLDKVPAETIDHHQIQVMTAHKFQGSEKDLMIASLVVSGTGDGGDDRWYDSGPQVLNVALSRARGFLCIVGDRDYCRSRPGTLGRLAAAFDAIENESQQDQAFLEQSLDSPAEKLMHTALLASQVQQLGYKIVPKFVETRYTLDFALVGPAMINVECDGLQHEMVGGLPVIEDVERDAFLESRGWTVVRIPNHRLWMDSGAVVEQIVDVAAKALG